VPPEGFVQAADWELHSLRVCADVLIERLIALQEEVSEQGVHDTRVQSRRLRAALKAYQNDLPPGQFRQAYDSVREITRALGGPREIAVCQALLRDLCAGTRGSENDASEYLLYKINRRLQKEETALRKRLRSLDPLFISARVDCLLSALETESSPEHGETPASEIPGDALTISGAHRMAQAAFLKLSKPLVECTRAEFLSADDDRLHLLRIAAKKLRYTIEFFCTWIPPRLDEVGLRAREVQDAGGKYHDWCILCSFLASEIAVGKKRLPIHSASRLYRAAEDQRYGLRKPMLAAIENLQQIMPASLIDCMLVNRPKMRIAGRRGAKTIGSETARSRMIGNRQSG
jgi:CHAD domain-containing protein